MRILLGLLGLSGLLMLATSHDANAAPQRVNAYSCGYLASSIGRHNVWQTWFTGERHQLFGPREHFTAAPCFKTRSACTDWLYWAQTDWPLTNTFRPCRKGAPY